MTKNNIKTALEEQTSSQVQIINKPLKLETVNEGNKEDDVLVRGNDNTIKYIPQSEFGGGSSQTLQQTLEAGNIAEFDNGNSSVKLFKGDPDSRTIELTTGDGSIRSSVSLGNTYASLHHSEPAPGHVHSNITATSEGIFLSNNDNGTNGWSNAFIVPNNTTSQTSYTLPIDRPNGNYTLATLDDIPSTSPFIPNIQQVLNAGSSSNDQFLTFDRTQKDSKTFIAAGTVVTTNLSTGESISLFDTKIHARKNTYAGNGNTIDFVKPTDGTCFYSLADKPDGNYVIATLDDITTNSPVSSTTTGIVDNTSLQELGGADKTINGIRIGKGNGTTTENILLGSANTFSLNTTGDYNTAVGYDSMIANTTGNNNSAFGEWALRSNTTGSSNTAVGVNALNANTSGTYNVAIGTLALNANKTASYNVAMGASALSKTIDGNNNVAFGASALRNNVSGNNNVAIGTSAMFNTVGNLNSNLDGCLCTAIGAAALYSNTTGNAIAVGANSLYNNTTGTYNIGIGDQAGSGITTGSGNTIIAGTGFILRGGGITTGSNNMILAPNSGNTTGITTGSGNVVVGKVTGLLATASNTITISDGVGNIAITKSTTGELKTPNLTQALIISGGATSLVTKGYVDNTGAVDNVTTTALSSTTLTATYPNALSGFRVRCLNITSGALSYEKTVSGWIQYAITITQ